MNWLATPIRYLRHHFRISNLLIQLDNLFFRLEKPVFLLTKYVMALEPKMRGGYFYPGAISRGKIATLNLVRTVSPTHTEVRVFMVLVKY